MEAGPAQEKLKTSEEEARVSGQEEACPGGKNVWNEPLSLLKRVAFLLDHPDIIPTDISFRIGAEAELFHGHKMFLALVSPVFHAMFYGNIKPTDNFVAIPDITSEAFRCLMEYAYTDSTASITVVNVMEVLAASRKYLMVTLTQYCYEFIQEKLEAETACFYWKTAREARTDIVEQQCIAEIKRNTGKVVLSDGFLNLPEDLILELTSWNELTVSEVDLYQAIKKWKIHQETMGRHVKFNREVSGILRHIRFALFPAERLAAEEDSDNIFSDRDFRELCLYKLVGKELVSFSANPRTPVAPSFRLSVSIFVMKNANSSRQLFGTLRLLIWPDVAPKACQVLRQWVEDNHNFQFSLMADYQDKPHWRTYSRQVREDGLLKNAVINLTTEVTRDTEETNALWSSPNFVCFKWSKKVPLVPKLTVLNTSLTALGGKVPESVFGDMCEHGVVIGKVMEGPIDRLRQLVAFDFSAFHEFDVAIEEQTWENRSFFFPTRFECSVIDD